MVNLQETLGRMDSIDSMLDSFNVSAMADTSSRLPGSVEDSATPETDDTAPSIPVAAYSNDAIARTQQHASPLVSDNSVEGFLQDVPTTEPNKEDIAEPAQNTLKETPPEHALLPAFQEPTFVKPPRGGAHTASWMGKPDTPLHNWKRDRGTVDNALMRSRQILLTVASLGTLFSVVQNEIILQGGDPNSSVVNFFKVCNTICSLSMAGLLARHYMLIELFSRIRMHLKALHALDINVPLAILLRNGWFWAEVLACVPHCPPFVTFEIIILNWTNLVMYRAETVLCVYNSMRIYLLWPVVRDCVLVSMPKRHTISSFTSTEMHSAFAFKRIMNSRSAFRDIGIAWAMSFLWTGYWFRAAEVNACLFASAVSPECQQEIARVWRLESGSANAFEKVNDLYLWNSLWGMFVTATSVGYGDITATTHTGRAVSFFAAVAGLTFTSALTAALSVALQWSEPEMTALLLVRREKARADMRRVAALMVQTWFRGTRRERGIVREANKQLLHRMWLHKQQFQMTKRATQVELEDCMADTAKFDTIYHSTRHIFDALQEVEMKVRTARVGTPGSQGMPGSQAGYPATVEIQQVEDKAARDMVREESALIAKARQCLRRRANKSLHNKSMQNQLSMSHKTKSMSDKTQSTANRGRVSYPNDQDGNKCDASNFHRNDSRPNDTHPNINHPNVTYSIDENDRISMVEKLHRKTVADTHISSLQGVSSSDLLQAARKHANETHDNHDQVRDHSAVAMGSDSTVRVADWRRNRMELDGRIDSTCLVLACVSFLGCVCGIAQNEWSLRSGHPSAAINDLFKTVNCLCSLVLFGLLYRQYRLREMLERLQKHLKRGHTYHPHVPASTMLANSIFWLEILLCCLALPPGVTGELSLQTLDNIVVYRFEMLGCCYNIMARLYVLWQPLAASIMRDVPNKQNVAAFANVKFDSYFVLKRMVNSWNAAIYILLGWIFFILLFGYLFRCTEITACRFAHTSHTDCLKPNAQTWIVYGSTFEKSNDMFVWNAMWLTFVTMTTVGYGDHVPSTHAGRLVCAFATITGILIASLITAAIANLIIYTPQESAAISVIEREQSRVHLRAKAATIIVLWYRRCKRLPLSLRQERIDKYALRREFLEHKLETMQEVEDLQSMSNKIDKVTRRIKLIEGSVELVAQHLWSSDDYLSMHHDYLSMHQGVSAEH